MKRVHGIGYRAVIQAAEYAIPEGARRLVTPDYLCGADPVFVGLHHYVDFDDGRSYTTTPHTVYDFHQKHMCRADRQATIVLPSVPTVATVVHEFGHVLHQIIGFDWDPEPVTAYATTDRYEAFAEAFTAWLMPHYPVRPDDRTLALFESLRTMTA